ncbi:MAG TPA: crosslink repair DNA glycosylase YcaQ family protein [Gaiellaceae bacterium]|nr:crosslink repair DNA glycosylase YcaQ family protein [Gaiellaceae bacterium]
MGTAVASLAAIRRLAVAAQAYAPRFRRAPAGDVEAAIRRLGAVQLDSISTVDRAHRLTLTSRIGAYDESQLQDLLTSGRVFEYWAHEACLLPIELWPHCRRTMEGKGHWGFHERALLEHGDLVDPVLERIRAEGPLGSRDFEGAGGKTDMWDWKPTKLVLEALFDRGVLVVAGRRSFQRRYDLAERVIPRELLDAPTPGEDDTLREFALLAVRARGALTEPAIREHWRLKGGRARLHHHVLALVDEGLLREVPADDDGPPFYVDAEADLDGDPAPPVLLCPFDNLLWDRPLLERLFGFRHVIEVYKREHERAYGYYVLPLLAGDRIIGRADLKADRSEGVLHVKGFHPEPRVRGNPGAKLERAALRLARVLGLQEVRHP